MMQKETFAERYKKNKAKPEFQKIVFERKCFALGFVVVFIALFIPWTNLRQHFDPDGQTSGAIMIFVSSLVGTYYAKYRVKKKYEEPEMIKGDQQ